MSLLLIAHGSPDPRHRGVMTSFAEQVELAAGTPVSVGFLEHNTPSVAEVLDAPSLSSPVSSAVGMFLSDGYHARVDVPKALAAHTPTVADLGTLGVGEWLLPALDRAVRPHWLVDDPGPGVAMVAAGSARAEARDEVIALAACWQRLRGAPVRAAFCTGPGPTLDEALSMLTDVGCAHQVVVPLMLAPGVLADRVLHQARTRGIPSTSALLADSGPPELVARVLDLVAISSTTEPGPPVARWP